MRDRRTLWIVAAVAALVALFLYLRPGPDDGAGIEAPPAGTATAGTGVATTPELEPAAGPDASVRAEIDVSGGRPAGGIARIEAAEGQTVILFVRADEPDEVHIHGYDVRADVGPGNVARIVFEADISGRFEIELHQAERLIGQLTVTP